MNPVRALVLVLLVSLVSACSGAAPEGGEGGTALTPYSATASSGASIEVRTAPAQPPVRGKVQLEVQVHDAAGIPRDGLTIDVVAWMPSHGHGAAGTPVVTPLGGGSYRVEGCALTMAGSWQIRMTMIGTDGSEDHATTTIDVQ